MKLTDNYGQSIDFEIPEKYRKIGVNCSGGADSSILVYMVAAYLKENNRTNTTINVMSCANDNKNRWNVRRAAEIINYTIDKLKWNQFDIHYSYYRDFQDAKYFHEIETDLFNDDRIDLVVSGLTANPKSQALVENSVGKIIDLSQDALDVRNSQNSEQWYLNNEYHFYTPFINVDKRFIAHMYDIYDVNDMIHLTRSCEATPQPPGHTHTVDYDPAFERHPCGKCWWCLEKKWAFGHF